MIRKKRKVGRPPGGPFKEKRALFATRITAETRKDLAAAAREHGYNLSQEAEFLLKRALQRVHNPRADIVALSEAIAIAIKNVERTTREHWIDSPFTASAIRHAIDLVLRHFSPRGTPVVPSAIEELAERLPSDYAVKYVDPAEVGLVEGGRLISEIEARGVFEPACGLLDLEYPETVIPDEWRRYRRILRKLRSKPPISDTTAPHASTSPRGNRCVRRNT
jgi:hypothetical protein